MESGDNEPPQSTATSSAGQQATEQEAIHSDKAEADNESPDNDEKDSGNIEELSLQDHVTDTDNTVTENQEDSSERNDGPDAGVDTSSGGSLCGDWAPTLCCIHTAYNTIIWYFYFADFFLFLLRLYLVIKCIGIV